MKLKAPLWLLNSFSLNTILFIDSTNFYHSIIWTLITRNQITYNSGIKMSKFLIHINSGPDLKNKATLGMLVAISAFNKGNEVNFF